MGAVKIKICGVKTPEVAEAVVEAGADLLGLVFVEKSARFVDIAMARRIVNLVEGKIQTVALMMNPDDDLGAVDKIEKLVQPDLYQLHGRAHLAGSHLSRERVIHAVSFDAETIAGSLMRFARNEMYGLVIDTPDPTHVGGGTGQTFDWKQLRKVLDEARPPMPIILAGGLSPKNVKEAIKVVKPAMVDVSSGVEKTRGEKDIKLIAQFCEAARSA